MLFGSITKDMAVNSINAIVAYKCKTIYTQNWYRNMPTKMQERSMHRNCAEILLLGGMTKRHGVATDGGEKSNLAIQFLSRSPIDGHSSAMGATGWS
jgi:hypothetical protein